MFSHECLEVLLKHRVQLVSLGLPTATLGINISRWCLPTEAYCLLSVIPKPSWFASL